MEISYRFLQILVLAVTAVVFTASMTCDKMILSDSQSAVNNRAANDVFETGRYKVKTTRRTASDPVQDLMSRLRGASEIQLRGRSFTAVLQSRDLKKVVITSLKCAYSLY